MPARLLGALLPSITVALCAGLHARATAGAGSSRPRTLLEPAPWSFSPPLRDQRIGRSGSRRRTKRLDADNIRVPVSTLRFPGSIEIRPILPIADSPEPWHSSSSVILHPALHWPWLHRKAMADARQAAIAGSTSTA
jgi:hypothetical protein